MTTPTDALSTFDYQSLDAATQVSAINVRLTQWEQQHLNLSLDKATILSQGGDISSVQSQIDKLESLIGSMRLMVGSLQTTAAAQTKAVADLAAQQAQVVAQSQAAQQAQIAADAPAQETPADTPAPPA